MTLALDRLFGLPAHPLLIHVPLVLIPITAVGAIAAAVWPRLRRTVGWGVVLLAIVSIVFIQLAEESGESLERHVKRSELIEEHSELADALLPIEAGVLVAGLGLVLIDRQGRSGSRLAWAKPAATGLAAVVALTAVASTVQVVRVGHSGAKAVWHDTPTSGRSGRDGDGDFDDD